MSYQLSGMPKTCLLLLVGDEEAPTARSRWWCRRRAHPSPGRSSTAEAIGRAVRVENISPTVQMTASTSTSTSSDSRIRPPETPPSTHAQARNGSALTRNATTMRPGGDQLAEHDVPVRQQRRLQRGEDAVLAVAVDRGRGERGHDEHGQAEHEEDRRRRTSPRRSAAPRRWWRSRRGTPRGRSRATQTAEHDRPACEVRTRWRSSRAATVLIPCQLIAGPPSLRGRPTRGRPGCGAKAVTRMPSRTRSASRRAAFSSPATSTSVSPPPTRRAGTWWSASQAVRPFEVEGVDPPRRRGRSARTRRRGAGSPGCGRARR